MSVELAARAREAIPAIVAAVRAGDQSLVNALLPAVTACDDWQAPFALRQALERDRTRPAHAPPLRALADRRDVAALLQHFHARTAADDLLTGITTPIGTQATPHIEEQTDFWCHQLFGHLSWRGDLLAAHVRPHRAGRLTAAHVDRWLTLWQDSIDAAFIGPAAEFAKVQAVRIATQMRGRLDTPQPSPQRDHPGHTAAPLPDRAQPPCSAPLE